MTGWTMEEWVVEARAVRRALASLGVTVPACLPGEPGDCGDPVWAHYGGYLALLKATAQTMIEVNLEEFETDQVEYFGHRVYGDYLDEHRRESGL